jgi:quercetin dioxygenase-like cupin family protein
MDEPQIDRQVRREAGMHGERTDFGSLHWVAREGDPPGAEMTIGIATFDAGKSNVEHVHPNCEEAVYVLEGVVEHTLGAHRTTLHTGDLITVPRGVAHQLINTSDAPARCYIVFSSPDRQFEPTGRA